MTSRDPAQAAPSVSAAPSTTSSFDQVDADADAVSTAERLLARLQSAILSSLSSSSSASSPPSSSSSSKNETVRDATSSIRSLHDPAVVASMLVPLLFEPPDDDMGEEGTTTGERLQRGDPAILPVLSHLISTDGSSYLVPVLRSVRDVADRLAAATSPSAAVAVVVSDAVLDALVSLLTSSSSSTSSAAASSAAASAIASVCRLSPRATPPELTARTVSRLVAAWKRASSSSSTSSSEASTVAVRCASSIVDVAVLPGNGNGNDKAMDAAIKCGATDLLLSMVQDGSDPLLQMSALDLIERLCTEGSFTLSSSRARWLLSEAVSNALLSLAGGAAAAAEEMNVDGGAEVFAEPDPIVGGQALRVVSSLCRLLGRRDEESAESDEMQIDDDHDNSRRRLLQGFRRSLHAAATASGGSSMGELERLAFVDAVSSYAASSPGAISYVLDDPIVRDGWLDLRVSQPRLKGAILTSVSRVLDPPRAENDDRGEVEMMSHAPPATPSSPQAYRLYRAVGVVNGDQDTTDAVLAVAKAPFVEARLGAYDLLAAAARRGGSIAHALLTHGEFLEFLSKREEQEKTKEGREATYEIVKAVVECDNASIILSDRLMETFEEIVERGPHYVKSMPWELATE